MDGRKWLFVFFVLGEKVCVIYIYIERYIYISWLCVGSGPVWGVCCRNKGVVVVVA